MCDIYFTTRKVLKTYCIYRDPLSYRNIYMWSDIIYGDEYGRLDKVKLGMDWKDFIKV